MLNIFEYSYISQLGMYGFTPKELDVAMHTLERYLTFQKRIVK